MKKFDIVARTGTYTDRSGEEKGRWLSCGAVFETDKGLSMKLECIPVGSEWNGFFSLFEPRQKGGSAPKQSPSEVPPLADDQIPF